jgi:UTP--glucose-1-phosphate uridylyltransferase
MAKSSITKAVIPAAGLGTRFLPATKAMPKEMLPVVDTPAIQYVVQEAVDAGLHDVLLVTGRNKNALENHFDRAAELEAQLEKKGDSDKLRKVNFSTELADVHYVRQGDPKGLGHAVLRARPHVGNESFAVLLGDDIIDQRDPLLTKMLDVAERRHTTVVALLEVDPSQIHLYGAAAVEKTDDPDVVKVTGLVEKPKAEDAPSNYAIIGRYVLRPEIFNILETTQPGKGGEIQLTDALQTVAEGPDWMGGVYGVVFRGRRYDTGDRLDYLKSIVRIAADREDLGPDFRHWLIEYASSLPERIPANEVLPDPSTGAIPIIHTS